MKKAAIHPLAALLATIVLLLLVNCGGGGKKDDLAWPRWRGPNGDGISKEKEWDPTALSRGPRIVWNKDLGPGYSNVAIENNRIYTMGVMQQNAVFCIDAETGKEIWTHQLEGLDEQQSTPTVEDGFVYALTKKGVLLCLRSANGELVWSRDLVAEGDAVKPNYGFASPPIIEGDLIILTANTSGAAFENKTGRKVWGSAAPPAQLPNMDPFATAISNGTDYSAPVIYRHGGRRFAVLSSYEGMYAVEVETGKVMWLHPWGTYSGFQSADPLVLGSRIFITQTWLTPPLEAFCCLLDTSGETPRLIWERHTLRSDLSSPVAIDDFIYGIDGGSYGNNSLRCLSVETGDMMWEQSWGGLFSLSAIAADGKLLILDEHGTLRIAEASPSAYRELSSCDVLAGEKKPRKFYTPPVLYRGRIYCRNFAGDLVCIDVRK